MRIVIFSGGTGSIALQGGLYNILEKNLDGVDTKILVNAYDNGLSTGDVRRVMEGRILGPSDVRKNQETRLRLINPESPWLRLLGTRLSAEATEVESVCKASVSRVVNDLERCGEARAGSVEVLFGAIKKYFRSANTKQIRYEKFSLANIIYAGLASANGNSLRAAARTMAYLLAIPDNVILNDDRSLFLGAVTSSGLRVADEGRIVCWDNETDPFVDVFFTDIEGREVSPVLCLEAWRTIIEADLIIMSSGTPWSSLIPTYASRGFKSAICQSKADVVMIMNRTPDRDSLGQSASDLINILVPRYFEAGRLHVLTDANGHSSMRTLNDSALKKVATCSRAPMSGPLDPPDRHDPRLLAEAVGRVVFREHLDSELYLFDYDDTLVAREKRWPRSSQYNVEAISRLNRLANVAICSGNTIRAIDLKAAPVNCDGGDLRKPLRVFADGGVNEYAYVTAPGEESAAGPHFVRSICDDVLLVTVGLHSTLAIVEALVRIGIPRDKIDIRGNAIVAIRPVEQADREALLRVVQYFLDGTGLEIRERGKTTLEVCKVGLSKSHALKYLCVNGNRPSKITYVGDEFESGNDRDVKEMASYEMPVKCLHVNGPAKTAFFFATLLAHLRSND